ncbi:uncharacterized protein LOC106637144 [Copidosoma floridanum]|uniref:uncharacterized protein LOC106637144 n=1 Tax=Copidosoma floridanum TaxID=29053 RepID=UPI0006C9B368|nr:uncharacterized protein LOC106637144 [Copidosoma floridanum]
MNKLVLLILALCITFVFAVPKLSGPFPNNRRKPVLSARQNFCEAGNGFHADKLRKIKETRIFPSDNSYYCYLGCFCTETKSIMTGDKFLSEKYIDIALTRTLSQQDSDNLISKCKHVKVAKDVCEAGKTIHNCFAAQKII